MINKKKYSAKGYMPVSKYSTEQWNYQQTKNISKGDIILARQEEF